MISRQATINIGETAHTTCSNMISMDVHYVMHLCAFVGTIGHVAHGKSTVVKAISGVQVCGYGLCVCKLV